MPPPTMAIRFMQICSLRNFLSRSGRFAIRGEGTEPRPRQIGNGANKKPRIVERFGTIQLHAALTGEVVEQNVDVEQNFDGIADESNRLDKHRSGTLFSQAWDGVLDGGSKPFATRH